MNISTVDAVVDHLFDLPPQFSALQLAVPEPEGTDAVAPVGISELGVERFKAGRRMFTLREHWPCRTHGQPSQSHSTDSKKIPACYFNHMLSLPSWISCGKSGYFLFV